MNNGQNKYQIKKWTNSAEEELSSPGTTRPVLDHISYNMSNITFENSKVSLVIQRINKLKVICLNCRSIRSQEKRQHWKD